MNPLVIDFGAIPPLSRSGPSKKYVPRLILQALEPALIYCLAHKSSKHLLPNCRMILSPNRFASLCRECVIVAPNQVSTAPALAQLGGNSIRCRRCLYSWSITATSSTTTPAVYFSVREPLTLKITFLLRQLHVLSCSSCRLSSLIVFIPFCGPRIMSGTPHQTEAWRHFGRIASVFKSLRQ